MNNKCNCNECENFEQCEIKIILHNFSGEQFTINKHDKIAQIMLKEHQSFLFGIDTENERVGGFGSSGN